MGLDLISASEVRDLLGGISPKTLQRYRDKYWIEGGSLPKACPTLPIQPPTRPRLDDQS